MSKMNFEQSMARLEQIVRVLEQGEAPLEESLKLFSEGTNLVAECSKLLDEAQMQISKVRVGADGEPILEAFSDEGV